MSVTAHFLIEALCRQPSHKVIGSIEQQPQETFTFNPVEPVRPSSLQQWRNLKSLLMLCDECVAGWDRDDTIWPWQGFSRYKK